MIIMTKFDVELTEWEVIPKGTKLEAVECEYSGFTGIVYRNNKYYLNNGYLVSIPELIGN